LEEVGVVIHDERALRIFHEAGANVIQRESRVKIPENLVRDSVRKAPGQFTIYDRNKQARVKYGDDAIYFSTGPNSPYILDLETNQVRNATIQDTEAGARLADALKSLSVVYALCTPQDVPPELQLLSSFEATLRNTVKPIEDQVGTGEIVRYCFRLASTVVGGEEELLKKPICFFTVEVTSPLTFHKPQIDILYESSIRGIPFKAESMSLTGLTGPVTLAGALAQSNAEVLTAVTLSQLINPGTPILFQLIPCTYEMRTPGLPVSAGPEVALMLVTGIQLARYYGLPARVFVFSNSVTPGSQAAYEKMLVSITAALAGANGIGCLGYLNNLTSFQQLVIDVEIADLTARFMKKFDVSDATLALDVIRDISQGEKTFLTSKHTLDNFAKEHLVPTLSQRLPRIEWEKRGAKEVADKARDSAREIIKKHIPEPLDKDIEKSLRRIMHDASRDLIR
jgi:trimethylamine--corrinoid protein Co-methyltransferase